jgi:acyltransferase
MHDPYSARRIDIDTAKGIGMILVIVGHSRPPDLAQVLIYGIHMPLFFFLSGLLWRGKVELARSVRALWWPFLFASVLSWLLWLVKQEIHGSDSQPLWGPLVATLWGGNLNGYLVHNTPLWFLPAMLSLHVVLWLLLRVLPLASSIFVLVLLCLPIIWLPTNSPLSEVAAALPMSLGQGLVGGLFFVFGHLFHPLTVMRVPTAGKATPLIGAAMLSIALLLSFANGRVDMYSLQFGDPLLYFFAGALGSFGITTLCRLPLFQQPILQLIGRHSLIILAVHLPLLWLLRAALEVAGVRSDWWLLTLGCTGLVYAIALWHERHPIFQLAKSHPKDRP